MKDIEAFLLMAAFVLAWVTVRTICDNWIEVRKHTLCLFDFHIWEFHSDWSHMNDKHHRCKYCKKRK